MSLTLDEVQSLLAPKPKYEALRQNGPLRWFDREMRCASRGCGSSTYCKVESVPYCTTHALRKLNELVIQITGLREKDLIARV
jgi:hypothetical protein